MTANILCSTVFIIFEYMYLLLNCLFLFIIISKHFFCYIYYMT